MFALNIRTINISSLNLLFVCFLFFSLAHSASAIVYVDINANGANNGLSWVNAHTSIQDAINNPASVAEQIWVGTGTYQEVIVLADNREIYGGFKFGDDEFSDRRPANNHTLIDATAAPSPNHAVTLSGVTGTVLDGFLIIGGTADGPGGSFNNLGGGVFCDNADASNRIRGCTIAKNFAISNGGGVFCRNGSSPQFINCTISGNNSKDNGGGIGLRSNSSPAFINCIISGNAADNNGGAVNCGSDVGPTFNNCTIVDNTAANGGGVFILLSSPVFINSIFQGNTNFAIYEGGAASDPIIKTSIFFQNDSGDYRDHDTDSGYTGAAVIESSAIGGTLIDLRDNNPLFAEDGEDGISDVWLSTTSGTLTSTLVTSEPLFLDLDLTGQLINVNSLQEQQSLILSNTPDRITIAGNLFAAEAGNAFRLVDYHLQFESLAVDNGTTEGIAGFDRDDNARPFDFEGVGQDGPGIGVDIGAYELQPDILEGEIIFVDLNAVGDNDGTTWENAYNQITLAINDPKSAFQEIWVAQGRYNETPSLADGNRIYGGFESGDRSREDRDPLANETILDATIFALPKRVVRIADVTSTTLDGFTITGGDNAGRQGGGLLLDNAKLTNILNCRIINNTASFGGGIAILNGSDPQMMHVQITGNNASVDGGGIYCDDSVTSFTDVLIGGNGSTQDGGGIFIKDSVIRRSTFNRCLLSGNSAQRDAGGIFSQNNTAFPLDFTNCIISGNVGDLGGGLFLLSDGGSRFVHCNISDNLAKLEGGGVFLIDSSPEFLNTTFNGNSKIALSEAEANSDPRVTFCLFENNPDGDYFDADTDSTYFGADAINLFVLGSDVENNVEGDTDFLMDSPDGIFGSWSANSEYDTAKNETTLLDNTASFTPNQLAGRLINVNIDQSFQAIILSNSESLIIVSGDLEALGLTSKQYKLIDYHPGLISALIDQGSNTSASDSDLDQNPRPVDVAGVGFDGPGNGFDIGVYEFQNAFPNIIVSPTALDFGNVMLGSSTTLELIIENDGVVELELDSMNIFGDGEGNFSFAETPDLAPLDPGSTRSLLILFTPQSLETKGATLSIESSDPEMGTLQVALSGNGTTVDFEVSPLALNFGLVQLPNSETAEIIITNTGNLPLEFTGNGLEITGDAEGNFALVNTDTSNLDAAGTRSVQVRFTPQSVGAKTATLAITTNDADAATVEVSLSGEGAAPNLVVTPNPIAFGDVVVLKEAIITVNLNNTGNAPLNFTGEGISLSGDSQFSFVDAPGTGTLAAGTSTTLQLSYIPQAVEINTAELTITADQIATPTIAIDISGMGIETPNISDILNYLLGNTTFSSGQMNAVDVNSDNQVNIQDILPRLN